MVSYFDNIVNDMTFYDHRISAKNDKKRQTGPSLTVMSFSKTDSQGNLFFVGDIVYVMRLNPYLGPAPQLRFISRMGGYYNVCPEA
jgi:hypothetical protein